MAYREKVTIVRADEIATDIYEMCFSTKNIAKEAKPGQFVSVYSTDGLRLLPRPISICGIEGDTLLHCIPGSRKRHTGICNNARWTDP